MAKKNEPKLASCKPGDVFKALKKLGGFDYFEGAKHTKITHVNTQVSFTIPRHAIVNRFIMKAFVEDYLIGNAKYTKGEIFEHLWC